MREVVLMKITCNSNSELLKVIKQKKKEQGKRQIIVQNEKNYACTYMIDEKGKKILIKKVPISEKNNESKSSPSDVPEANLECEKKMINEGNHKRNVKEMMNIIEESVGIPNSSKKNGDYL